MNQGVPLPEAALLPCAHDARGTVELCSLATDNQQLVGCSMQGDVAIWNLARSACRTVTLHDRKLPCLHCEPWCPTE